VCTKAVTISLAVYRRIGVHVCAYCVKSHVVSQYYLRNIIKICTVLGKFKTGNVTKKQSKTTCRSMYSVHEEYTFMITRKDGLTH